MAKIKSFNASFPDLQDIPDVSGFFDQAKHLFPEYRSRDVYQQDQYEAIYIYEQENIRGSHVGIITLVDVQDYLDGKIIRHELTLEAKENIMLGLLEERQAMIKPAVITYPEVPEISKKINRLKKRKSPDFSAHYLGSIHRIWAIRKKKQIARLVQLFSDHVPLTYIGDGHHRAATSAIRYKKLKSENPNHTGNESYNFLLSAFFADKQLKIFEFNRVVSTLNRYSPKGLKAELRKNFLMTKSYEPVVPQSKYEIGMYISNKWYRLTPKDALLENGNGLSDKLAVSIWNREILGKVLNIHNPRTDSRIKYIEGPKGVEAIMKKVGKNSFAVGFSFYPIPLKEVMDIADAGETMPPKSTWFAPRMHNGMIVHLFDPVSLETLD